MCHIQKGIPHELNINLISTTTNWLEGLNMPSWRIVGYVGIGRNTTHPKVHAKLIPNLQTSFKYGSAIHTAGLADEERITNSISVSVNNKSTFRKFRHAWKEQKTAKNSSSKIAVFLDVRMWWGMSVWPVWPLTLCKWAMPTWPACSWPVWLAWPAWPVWPAWPIWPAWPAWPSWPAWPVWPPPIWPAWRVWPAWPSWPVWRQLG